MSYRDFYSSLEDMAGHSVCAGSVVELNPDVLVVSDVVSKGCLEGISSVASPEKVEIVIEHGLPSVFEVADEHREMVRFAAAHKTRLNHGDGISYYCLSKRKEAGETICTAAICGGNVSMLGAAGILGIRVSPEEMKELITQDSFVKYTVPEVITVKLTGSLKEGVTPRDAAMKLAADKREELAGKCVELSGVFSEWPLDDRLEFTNYLTAAHAAGAWIGTAEEASVTLNLGEIAPMIACPGGELDIIPAAELKETVPFRLGFIGGCGGGTIKELRQAARYLKGKTVAYGMRLCVAPNSRDTYIQAAKEGLIQDFIEAGAVFMNPGCLSCTGISCGRTGENEVSLSTGLFNKAGCCGAKSAKVYLASAETVARGCVDGTISKALGGF